jgi:hypothetical protein
MYNERIEKLADLASKVNVKDFYRTKNYLVLNELGIEYRMCRTSVFSDSFYIPTMVDEDRLEGCVQSEKERLYNLLEHHWNIYDNIKIPCWFLPYIVYGESEEVSDEDINKWNSLVQKVTNGGIYEIEYDPESYFSYNNDITQLGDDVYDITIYVAKD